MRHSNQLLLKEYAESRGIHYLTAWRHLKKGLLTAKRMPNGSFQVKVVKAPPPIGHPLLWTKEKTIQAVYKLCKGRYVKASEFPHFLYKLCNKFCGSVRAAKWEAKIIHGKTWNYEKFIKCVYQYCRHRYRAEKDWPIHLRLLAKRYCGSIRRAKWEARVIRDRRHRVRKNQQQPLEELWTKEKYLEWVETYCNQRYRKATQWPSYMRQLAVRYFGSIRKSKWAAKILKDRRKQKRP